MIFPGKGTLIVDLEGTIAYANAYFCELMGSDPESTKGMSCFEFVFPEDMDKAKQLFEANKLPEAPAFRFRLRHREGMAVWVDVQGTAIRTPSGEACAITAVITPARGA